MKTPSKSELIKQLAKCRKELEAANKELVEDVGVCKVLRRQRDTAENYLRQTYNILHSYDPEKETPMDEVFGLILTAAHVARKQLVELSAKKGK